MLCGVSAVFFLWFTLACQQYVSNSKSVLYISSILGGFFLNGSIPLCFELGVEATHPIAEGDASGAEHDPINQARVHVGITTGTLMTSFNCFVLMFLIVPQIPGLGQCT